MVNNIVKVIVAGIILTTTLQSFASFEIKNNTDQTIQISIQHTGSLGELPPMNISLAAHQSNLLEGGCVTSIKVNSKQVWRGNECSRKKGELMESERTITIEQPSENRFVASFD